MARELKTFTELDRMRDLPTFNAKLDDKSPFWICVEIPGSSASEYLSPDQFRQFCMDGLEMCAAADHAIFAE